MITNEQGIVGQLDIKDLKVSTIKENSLNKKKLFNKKRHDDFSNQSISYIVVVMEKARQK